MYIHTPFHLGFILSRVILASLFTYIQTRRICYYFDKLMTYKEFVPVENQIALIFNLMGECNRLYVCIGIFIFFYIYTL